MRTVILDIETIPDPAAMARVGDPGDGFLPWPLHSLACVSLFTVDSSATTPLRFDIETFSRRDLSERGILSAVENRLENADQVRTFNGRGFDAPLLVARGVPAVASTRRRSGSCTVAAGACNSISTCSMRVGALDQMPGYNNQELIMHRRTLAGSLIGSIRETQDVLDFCAEHGVAPDVEVIAIQDVNDAYKRVKKEGVRFRYGLRKNWLYEGGGRGGS